MTVDEFREIILVQDVDDILINILLSDNPKHVDKNSQNYIKQKLSEVYKIVPEELQLYIVGSSNLGFSISSVSCGFRY